MFNRKGIYKGYSSHEFPKTGSFKINDRELVKLDIMNHLFTPPGSRVMMPTYGTIIPQLVFEPMTLDLDDIIAEEIERVIDSDPRVELIELNVVPDYENLTITAAVVLRFIELNEVDALEFNIPVGGK